MTKAVPDLGDYGFKVAGWDIRFVMATSALAREAVERATERDLAVEHKRRSVRGRILRPEDSAT